VFVLLAFLDIVHVLTRPSGVGLRNDTRRVGTRRCASTIGASGIIRGDGDASVIPVPRRAAGIIRAAAGIIRFPATEYCFCAGARTGRSASPNFLCFVSRFHRKPQAGVRRFSQGVS
jgi:hypothetical protein